MNELEAMFAPQSVAVIGASTSAGKICHDATVADYRIIRKASEG